MQPDGLEEQIKLEQNHWWFRARRRIVGDVVRALIAPSKETLIVDVGCGVGVDAQAFATDYEFIGIDQWSEAIAVARSHFRDAQFICVDAPYDLGGLALRTRLFLVTDILEHAEDDQALFRSLFDAARPGTYFLLTVPTEFADWSARDPREDDFRRYNAAKFMGIWRWLPVEETLLAWVDWRLRAFLRLPLAHTLVGLASWRDHHALPSAPPPIINHWLETIFFGEARALLKELRGARRKGYRRAATLMAVLRKLR